MSGLVASPRGPDANARSEARAGDVASGVGEGGPRDATPPAARKRRLLGKKRRRERSPSPEPEDHTERGRVLRIACANRACLF